MKIQMGVVTIVIAGLMMTGCVVSKKEYTKLQDKLAVAEGKLEKTGAELDTATKDIQLKAAETTTLKSKVKELEDAGKQKAEELEKLQADFTKIGTERDGLKTDLEKAQKAVTESADKLKADLEAAQKEHASLKALADKAGKDLEAARKELDAVKKELETVKKQLEEARAAAQKPAEGKKKK